MKDKEHWRTEMHRRASDTADFMAYLSVASNSYENPEQVLQGTVKGQGTDKADFFWLKKKKVAMATVKEFSSSPAHNIYLQGPS